ncbi:MAG TPA: S8 family serine peptidase [Thermoanaerobaculia bacterium]|nr:S8 family serine peptidase [Thermoanaerobaculia bacterium]
MKKLLAILITLAAATPLVAQTKTRYLISIRRPVEMTGLRMLRDPEDFAAHAVRTFKTLPFVAADLTDAEVAALKKSADVNYVSAVVPRYIDGDPANVGAPKFVPVTDSRYSNAQTVWYGIDLVHARDVWPVTKGNRNAVNVAVVDTGIDYHHPELKDQYQGGYNVFTQKNDPMDDHAHGTHVSGIITAADNNFGVVGVAPEVHLWGVKVLQSTGQGTDESVIAGMDWVINKKKEIGGNWIVNLSLGASAASEAERQTFARAIDAGILICAAAGNRATKTLDYPGAYDQVIAVSAIDDQSQLADFSSYGPGVGFAAPGVGVLSTVIVGSAHDTAVVSGANTLRAWALTGSQNGEVKGQTAFCGIGNPEDFPVDIKGKIAVIRRGTLTFHDKVQNAIKAGAAGVIIVPNDDRNDMPTWTLWPPVCDGITCSISDDDKAYPWGVALAVNKADGDQLVADAGKNQTLASNTPDDYAILSGTSMATPHVVGTAALVWSLAPDATAQDIRLAMKLSADDLGEKGYDIRFGYGRIDALTAAKYIAPGLFGLPPTPPATPTRRRPSSHH